MRVTVTVNFTNGPEDRYVVLERSGHESVTISSDNPSVEVDLPEEEVLRLFAGALVNPPPEPEPEPAPAE